MADRSGGVASNCIRARQVRPLSPKGSFGKIRFYSGFPNWDTFNAVFEYLNPGNEGQNILYWVSKLNVNVSAAVHEGENEEALRKKGRPRYVRPIDEFLQLCAD